MESIDALAKAVNEFEGGMVLVSHDMRLISQVAKEIWICDHKTITKWNDDIQSFKMHMRAQIGIDNGDHKARKLRGDASVKQQPGEAKEKKPAAKPKSKLEVVKPKAPAAPSANDDATAATTSSSTTVATDSCSVGGGTASAQGKYIPPHLRRKMPDSK